LSAAVTGLPPDWLAFFFDLLSLPVVVLLGYRLFRRMVAPMAAFVFLLAALSPEPTRRVFTSGMETPLYLVGLLSSLEAFARDRQLLAFGLAGGLFFLHPEAALLAPSLWLAGAAAEGRWGVRPVVLGAVPTLAGLLLLTLLFGSPLPQAVTAKRAAYAMAPGYALSELSETILDVFLPGEIPVRSRPSEGLGTLALLIPPLAFAGLLGASFLRTHRALRRKVVVASTLFATSYLAVFGLANPLVFDWYRPPLALAMSVAVAGVVGALPEKARILRTVWIMLAALAAAVHLWGFRPYEPSGREGVYGQAVEELSPAKSDVLAAPEIGAIGYFSRARILDTSGLVSPEALPFLAHRIGAGGAIPPGLLAALTPRFVISLSFFLRPLTAADPMALDGYHLRARYPAFAFGRADEVLVYQLGGDGAGAPVP
jgi:hypothetical protein